MTESTPVNRLPPEERYARDAWLVHQLANGREVVLDVRVLQIDGKITELREAVILAAARVEQRRIYKHRVYYMDPERGPMNLG